MPTPMKFSKSWADMADDNDDIVTTYNTDSNTVQPTMSPNTIAIQSSPNYVPSSNTNNSSTSQQSLSWGDLVSKVVHPSKHVTPAKQLIDTLDDSNDGLPLMIKQMNKPSAHDTLEHIAEESSDSASYTMIDSIDGSHIPSRSASLIRADSKLTKRKQTEPTTSSGTVKSVWSVSSTSNLINKISGSPCSTLVDPMSPDQSKKQKLTETTELRRSARKSSVASTMDECNENDKTSHNQQPNIPQSAEQRLQSRLKSIRLVKQSDMYKNYISVISYHQRTRDMPSTPKPQSKTQNYSKRGFAGLLRVWRKQLSDYKTIESARQQAEKYQLIAAGQPCNISEKQQWMPAKSGNEDADWELVNPEQSN